MTTGKKNRASITKLLAILAAMSMTFAACAEDDPTETDTSESTETDTDEDAMDDKDDGSMDDKDAMDDAKGETLGASGPGCASVPEDGAGSFAGMSAEPAATAASANPLLSTLVTAVTEADLVDTLNGDGPFTIFAPTNDAFAAIPEADLNALLADKDELTKVLTFHVVAGQLSAEDLVADGSATTVEGTELTFAASGDAVEVNGSATTICQDVPTANATVHIIDGVLLPS